LRIFSSCSPEAICFLCDKNFDPLLATAAAFPDRSLTDPFCWPVGGGFRKNRACCAFSGFDTARMSLRSGGGSGAWGEISRLAHAHRLVAAHRLAFV
jgi:hypothetical protein